jgi:hypothetical protein
LHMVCLERMQGKWSNLPLCCIYCGKDILCWNMMRWRLCLSSYRCRKIVRNTRVITLVGQWQSSCIKRFWR